jgi:glycosyltransferase involved in cell wall biosynthesis
MSVVICCHNGKARIGATLEALAKCSARFPVEILLVDNGSNDGTSETAVEVWKRARAPMTLRVVPEPKPGLAYARKRGVLEAAHELVVFCDAPAWPPGEAT